MPGWITNSHGVPERLSLMDIEDQVVLLYRCAEEIARELHFREVAMWASYGHFTPEAELLDWSQLSEGVQAAKCNAVRTMIQEGRIRLP